jgi:TrmH family RNA methyltransferase
MITSVKNPRVQWIRRLQGRSKERRADKVFVVEGIRLVEEAQGANWTVRELFYSSDLAERGMRLVHRYQESETRIDAVSNNVMQAMSDTKNPQGILAAIEMKSLPVTESPDFLLILDQINDPGNLGTILRTASAANVQAVYLTPGTVDPFSPKVVRAGMGAHFRMPIIEAEWNEVHSRIDQTEMHIFLAATGEGDPYYDSDFSHPLALIIGSEAHGAGQKAFQLSDSRVYVPMPGGGNSLNASVAAGIMLFEIIRQRENK